MPLNSLIVFWQGIISRMEFLCYLLFLTLLLSQRAGKASRPPSCVKTTGFSRRSPPAAQTFGPSKLLPKGPDTPCFRFPALKSIACFGFLERAFSTMLGGLHAEQPHSWTLKRRHSLSSFRHEGTSKFVLTSLCGVHALHHTRTSVQVS